MGGPWGGSNGAGELGRDVEIAISCVFVSVEDLVLLRKLHFWSRNWGVMRSGLIGGFRVFEDA